MIRMTNLAARTHRSHQEIHTYVMAYKIACISRPVALAACALILLVSAAHGQNTNANIATTKHNFSASGPGTVKSAAPGAGGTDQVCVFCHTPHSASAAVKVPLWNRTLSGATYVPYSSNSLDAQAILGGPLEQPGGASKLCLSCHDGTLAIGTVDNAPGSGNGSTIAMTGTGTGGVMPDGAGATTGFTRKLGVDLSNDHPISLTFNATLSARDGELRQPPYTVGGKPVVGIRTSGNAPMLPLDHEGKVQCTSCHDPHLDASKFLRLNRFQAAPPSGGEFNATSDQICLGCHSKLGTTWSNSAHANDTTAGYAYTASAATMREFPANTKVWEAGCLNCHDTHTVQGSRRLLREGTDSVLSPKTGGNPAIEETCYQCHTSTGSSVIISGALTASTGVPDIKSEFTNRTIRMPITTDAQGGGGNSTEVHNIGGSFSDPAFIDCTGTTNKCGADFIESRSLLGATTQTNRHAECTDCHNPHRVLKNSLLNGLGSATRRTHEPAAGTNGADGNVASGVLRGIWGVEPQYLSISSTTWSVESVDYTVKRGDPGANTSTAKTNTFLTREYQLCLKCHSDYAGLTPPLLGHPGGTFPGTNGMTRYTNVAAEFAAFANDSLTGADQGENGNDPAYAPSGSNGAPNSSPTNHRSWHPVIFPTGRTAWERTGSSSRAFTNIRSPFNTQANIGKQTMQCSDCHGSSQSWSQQNTGNNTNGPNLSNVQGPHGSDNPFLLKGIWDISIKIDDADGSNTRGTICGRCHAPRSGAGGFSNGDAAHSKSDHTALARCMFCHIAVPHGWKNKAFLANLLCIGPEVGKPAGCSNAFNDSGEVTKQLWVAPYYNGALLRVTTWKSSNAWSETSCGGGSGWMSGTCDNAKTTQQPQSTGY